MGLAAAGTLVISTSTTACVLGGTIHVMDQAIRTTCASVGSWILRNGRLDALHGQPVRFPLDPCGVLHAGRERSLKICRKVDLVVRYVVDLLSGGGRGRDGDGFKALLGEGSGRNQNGLLRQSVDLHPSYNANNVGQ
jgi:hypothetical protein